MKRLGGAIDAARGDTGTALSRYCIVCSTQLRSFNAPLSAGGTDGTDDHWVVCSIRPTRAPGLLQPLSPIVIAKVVESEYIRPFSISLSISARKTLLLQDFDGVTVSLLDGSAPPRK
jgi:hypothetical protein